MKHMLVLVRRFSDVRIYETETSPTIEQGSGAGGNNVPMVLQIDNETEDIDREKILRVARRR